MNKDQIIMEELSDYGVIKTIKTSDLEKCEGCAKYEYCTMCGKANCLEYEECE